MVILLLLFMVILLSCEDMLILLFLGSDSFILDTFHRRLSLI